MSQTRKALNPRINSEPKPVTSASASSKASSSAPSTHTTGQYVLLAALAIAVVLLSIAGIALLGPDTSASSKRSSSSNETDLAADRTSNSPSVLAEDQLQVLSSVGQAAPSEAPEGMVWIPGGTFLMGSENYADSQPVQEITVSGYWMDQTEVTNRHFAEFVEQTGYVTVAERPLELADFPGMTQEQLDQFEPGSSVFTPPMTPVSSMANHLQWWAWKPGANWRHPEGPESSIGDRLDHPVVQICWEDAQAYARWAGKELPTEAQWEFAARGGLNGKVYAWGDQRFPEEYGERGLANTHQGQFPTENLATDGFLGTAPVKSYPPNGYGLYDVAGNVWEWCADWYHSEAYRIRQQTVDPTGPESSYDPAEPDQAKRVQKGGSFLCSDLYCVRYEVGSRGKGEVRSTSNHIGFRCVKVPEPSSRPSSDRQG